MCYHPEDSESKATRKISEIAFPLTLAPSGVDLKIRRHGDKRGRSDALSVSSVSSVDKNNENQYIFRGVSVLPPQRVGKLC